MNNRIQPVNKANNLTEIQHYILSTLISVIDILNRLNITYYMQGGTMLGAVRHSGFIPWDDDVDLGIPRTDYERFLKEVERELPDNLELQTYWDKSNHHYYFARIVDIEHSVKRLGSAEVRYENIWVDIFPLDGMPNFTIHRHIHMFKLSWARLLYHLSCIRKVNIKRPGRPLIERIVIKAATILDIGRLLNQEKCLDRIDRLLKKFPVSTSEWIINFMGQTSFKFTEMIHKSVYGKPSLYNFESIKLLGPEKYDEYLKSLYGDYMTPPKDADKNAHVSELVRERIG